MVIGDICYEEQLGKLLLMESRLCVGFIILSPALYYRGGIIYNKQHVCSKLEDEATVLIATLHCNK